MALEPMVPAAHEDENAELHDLTRRFWISALLTLPLLWALLGEAVPKLDPMRLFGHSSAPADTTGALDMPRSIMTSAASITRGRTWPLPF